MQKLLPAKPKPPEKPKPTQHTQRQCNAANIPEAPLLLKLLIIKYMK